MKGLLKNAVLYLILINFIFISYSCAHVQKTWISDPVFQTVEKQSYEVRIEPLKGGNDFYVKFRLDVKNKTGQEIKIDWNKTKYLLNGKSYGAFVFKGINPDDIKSSSIPDDIVSAKSSFSKEISPFKMIARGKIRDESENGIHAGILPNGKNGIHLVIKHKNEEIVERLSVIIKEK